jgi:oligoendopeptidase F
MNDGNPQTDNSLKQGFAVAEVPSTFAELLMVEHLLSTDEDLGRALLARELDQAVVSAYVSAAFARFEHGAYALRAEGQALNADRLNALCEAAVAKVWGDAVTDELGSGKLFSGRRCRTSSTSASTPTPTPSRSC